jgi:hypothetical protein
MTPPFSAEQFFGVFTAYNQAVWPAQLLLVGLAVGAVGLALRPGPRRGRAVAAILACLWVWMGVAYHWAFFAGINPAARAFGALFVLEGLLLSWAALRWEHAPRFEPGTDPAGVAGAVLVAYALVVYPLLGWSLGHRYPAQPTFGLPCPTTIFTLGVLLWVKPRPPWILLAIPVAWAVIATGATRYFGVWEDAMLPLAALTAVALTLGRPRRSRAGRLG